MAYRTRRRRKQTPRPICTYEVTYTYVVADNIIHDTLKFRCKRLTAAQLKSNAVLVGDVSTRKSNGQWTTLASGSLPGNDHAPRVIRELIEAVVAVVPPQDKP